MSAKTRRQVKLSLGRPAQSPVPGTNCSRHPQHLAVLCTEVNTHPRWHARRQDARGHRLVSLRSPSCTCAGKCTSLWFPERLLGSQSPVFLLNAAGPKMTKGGRQNCWRSDGNLNSRACHKHDVEQAGKRQKGGKESFTAVFICAGSPMWRHREQRPSPRLASIVSRNLFKSAFKYVH